MDFVVDGSALRQSGEMVRTSDNGHTALNARCQRKRGVGGIVHWRIVVKDSPPQLPIDVASPKFAYSRFRNLVQVTTFENLICLHATSKLSLRIPW